jgi:outer membrane protein assembly factor BamD
MSTTTVKRPLLLTVLVGMLALLFPTESPAPLVWRKGEGWTYEREGVTTGKTPPEQLEIAKALHENKEYGNAITAYRRLIRRWPTAAAAQDARLGLAQCLSAIGYHYRAFKEYQQLIERHPNTPHFETVLQRQFEIANLFQAGERDKAFGVRWFPAPAKAIEIYSQIVKNGPYSKIAPEAQFRIGLTHEKQRAYLSAVRAYERLLERYPRHPLAEAAQFQIGAAYRSEAARAEYDQNAANQAIAAFTEFLVRHPNSEKAPLAEQYRAELKVEQVRGLFRIGQFYEKKRSYEAALVYYNEVIEQHPRSTWAEAAQEKIASLTSKLEAATATP